MNLGLTYTDLYDFKQANFYLAKMQVIIPKVNEQYIIALIYQGIGYSLNCQSNCKNALINLEKSIKIAEEQHLDDIQPTNYLFISQAYMCLGDGIKASEYYKKHERTRDQSNKTLNDSRVKFETAQQEKEIQLLNRQQEVNQKLIKAKEIETKQQRLIIYIFIVGLLFIVVFLMIVINQYRQKKKANIKLGEQKLLLEDQKRNIDDSINYAQRIQEAVLSLNDTTGTILDKSFVLFRPKSVVSGDFYWATIVNEWAIIAVADCTGHGVPGAFMSMLGVSFLSEIVRKSEINQASQVLGELREYIIDALKQQGRIGEQKDGMDIALCAINIKTLECQYSGANNPLYVFKKSSLNLIEIKPDKMPVAIYDKMDDFTNHTIQLEKGDRLYLFSDGYADQFGGVKGKKFMKKSLKELIFKTSSLGINEQCRALESELDKWMLFPDITTGLSHEQIDDITLMGVEI